MIGEDLQKFAAVQRLLALQPAALTDAKVDRGELTVVIKRIDIFAACELLKNDPQLRFDLLADLTALDWYPTEPRFEVVYQLYSTSNHQSLRVKAKLSEQESIESVTSIWPTAAWYEREVYDLFGVRFDHHPNMKRLMMPDDWEGHPLRKDYPVEGYR